MKGGRCQLIRGGGVATGVGRNHDQQVTEMKDGCEKRVRERGSKGGREEGRKEERKEGRKEGGKEGRKEGRKERRKERGTKGSIGTSNQWMRTRCNKQVR